ncbi:MAG: hypothetical protein CMH27_07520 [Micavibrio sp.]|nr:hypothetical protein [Micavibrio sp.]
MSYSFSKAALPVIAILALSACENMYLKPLALPTGYTYHNDDYKSPPSPQASGIGYEYSAEKNAHILQNMRVKAEDMFAQIQAQTDLTGKALYVYNARHHDAQNAAFDHVLRDVVRKNGYVLAKAPGETGSYNLGYAIMEKDDLNRDVNFGDMNEEYRKSYYHQYDEYEDMFIDMVVFDGEKVVTKYRANYDLPMYGYERHGGFFFIKPQLGEPDKRADGLPVIPVEEKPVPTAGNDAPLPIHQSSVYDLND